MRVERNIAMNPIPLPIIDLRRAAAVLLLIHAAAFLAFPMTEGAAQTVNPTAQSVQEEMLFEELQGPIAGRVSIPNERAGTLIAPENRDWSNMRRGTLFTISMVAIVGALVVLTAFYLIKGPAPIEAGRSGRTILRFNGLERFAHWLTAVTFIVLGITGLNVTFGRRLVLPLIGEDAFGTLSIWMKITHNFIAWPFMLGVLLIFVLWVRDNLPAKEDGPWIRHFGGFFTRGMNIPAWRFNAGQKGIFWAVVIGGAAMSWTGLVLLFPHLAETLGGWQTAQSLHGVIAAIMVAIILAHIYIGSIGMEGAFEAMGSGEVDLNWAKEHHSLWVEEELGRGAARPDTPKGSPATASR